MNTSRLTCLLSLSLVTTTLADPSRDSVGGSDVKRDDPAIAEALRNTPWMAGPTADAFQEALHTEEVARDLDAAASQYAAIVEKIRARDDDWGAGAAAISLFRLAEIRRKQGREEEARKHYEEVVAEFQDWEPMVSLSRQQLGLDPSDFLPEVTKLEDDRELTTNVERSLWKVRSRTCDDPFVLVTFEVKPDEEASDEGMPEAGKVETLHYNPGATLTGFISSTCVKGDPVKVGKILGNPIRGTLGTRVSGFGHSYDVPGGLRRTMAFSMAESDWIGQRGLNFDAKVGLKFNDEMDEKSKGVRVVFTVATISEAKARELAESRSVAIPELGDRSWSFTLPPSPAELEQVLSTK